MLGLGTGIQYPSSLSLVKLAIQDLVTTDIDDENVMVTFTSSNAATRNALLSGITQATGAKVNGTFELTVTNVTSDPDDVAVDTFNVFQYDSGNTTLFFLSLATSNITISGSADYHAVDLTAGTFVGDSLDASGSGEIYSFSGALSIPGFDTSDSISVVNLSIDAA